MGRCATQPCVHVIHRMPYNSIHSTIAYILPLHALMLGSSPQAALLQNRAVCGRGGLISPFLSDCLEIYLAGACHVSQRLWCLRVAPFHTLISYGCLLMLSHKHTQGSYCFIFGMGLHAVGQHKMCVASGADLCHVMSEHKGHVADKV